MSARKDPIKKAGAEKIKKAAEKAQAEINSLDSKIELSVCGGLSCHPLSMARKLAISRFIESCPDADETEIALVSTYILSLPQKDFWKTVRKSNTILEKAVAFADESDPDSFEALMNDAAAKISHLQETSSMQSDSGDGEESGNALRSPE